MIEVDLYTLVNFEAGRSLVTNLASPGLFPLQN